MNAQGDANVRPGRTDEAPWDAVDELFYGVATVMWDARLKRWDARAQGCTEFAHAATPAAAMRAALNLKAGKKAEPPAAPTPRPRAKLIDDAPSLFTARRKLL